MWIILICTRGNDVWYGANQARLGCQVFAFDRRPYSFEGPSISSFSQPDLETLLLAFKI